MAVFTAIAAAIGLGKIATAIFVAVGTFVTSMTVSRIMAKRAMRKAGAGGDGGGRIQLPPATDNKIPIIYGNAFLGGPIFDAYLTPDQKTMYYAIAMAEVPDYGSITFGDIYYDGKLTTRVGASVTQLVTNTTPAQIDNRVSGKLFIYTFGNGSNDPLNQALPAYSIMPNWNSTYTMTNCAFIIVKVIFDQNAGTTNLGAITAEVISTETGQSTGVFRPGTAIKDYLTNVRYGCALPLNAVDTDSLDALNTYSDELIEYIPSDGDTTPPLPTQPRYRINGPLDTADNCLNNLQNLVDSCDSWLQYSELTGQWKVVINKPYEGSFSSLFEVNSDNLIGGIQISPIDLNETFNQLEVAYPNENIKDQTDYQIVLLEDYVSTVLSPNEADNRLNLTLGLVNNAVQAKYLGVRRLLQSREDLVISCDLDYSGIQIEAGDVIRVTHPIYGWTDKLFRVSQVSEEKKADGTLGASIAAFEYNATIYEDNAIQDFVPAFNTGLLDPNVITEPGTPTANLNPDDTGAITSFRITSAVPESGSVIYMDFNYGNTSNVEQHVLYRTVQAAAGQPFTNSGNIISNVSVNNISIDINDLVAGTYYFSTTARNDFAGRVSLASNSFVWPGAGINAANIIDANGVYSNGNVLTSNNAIPNIAVNANVYLLSGTGQLANNTYITIVNSTSPANFEVTPTPIIALDNAEIQIITGGINGNAIIPNTMPGNRVTPNTLPGNTIVPNTLPGNTLIGNTVNGNVLISGTVNGNAIISGTVNGNALITGTVNGNVIISGTISNLQIADDTIIANNIRANAITSDKITANAITAGKIDANAVTANTIAANAVTAGKIDANAVTANTIAANAITAGKIDANAVTANTIAANAITAGKIDANAVTANTIAANAVVVGKIDANAVTANTIAANAVVVGKIDANAVTANTIAANAVTAGKIDANAVTAGTIAAGAITAGSLAANSVTANELAANSVIAGKIDANAVTANTIAANAVTAGKIDANAVTANTIAANAVTAGKIDVNAVTANTIAANAITVGKIDANAVTANTIAANAITAGKIDANAVTANTIAANAITAGKIDANAVTSNTIAANAITAGKIDANAVDANALQAFAVTAGKIAAGSVFASDIAANTITFENLAIGAVTQSKSTLSDPIVQPIPFTNVPNVWPDNTRCIIPSGGVTIIPSTDPGSSANTEYVEGSRIQVSYSVKMYVDPGNVANASQNWDQFNLVEVWKSGASSVFDRGINTIRQAYDLSGNATSASYQQLHAYGYDASGLDLYSIDGGNSWSIYEGNSTNRTITGAFTWDQNAANSLPRTIGTNLVGLYQARDYANDGGIALTCTGVRTSSFSAGPELVWISRVPGLSGANAITYRTSTNVSTAVNSYNSTLYSMEMSPDTGGNGYPYRNVNVAGNANVGAGVIITGTNGDIFYSNTAAQGAVGSGASALFSNPYLRRENVPGLFKDLYASYSNPMASNTYTAVAVGQGGTILRSERTINASDFANSWDARLTYIQGNVQQPLLTDLYAVAGDNTNNSPSTSVWTAVGQYGMIQVSTDDGDNWDQVFLGNSVTCDFNGVRYGNGVWVACGDGGNIYISNDASNANAWTQIDTGNLDYTNGSPYGSIYGTVGGNVNTNARQLNTVNYNGEWDTWSIGGQGLILYSDDNANTWQVAYEIGPSEVYDFTRLTYFGSGPNVANVSRPPAEQRILNNQIFSGTILDSSYVAGQETTYYLVIGNMNGNTVLAGQIFLQVQEIKR